MLSISSINTKFMRASLFASAAIMIGVSLPAMAQDAPADDESANAEIIVTAQKREERLQDIPLAVSVIGGDAVANNGGITLENA